MLHLKNVNYWPGGEHENSNTSPRMNEDQKDSASAIPEIKEAGVEHKSVIEKIKDALQDWSNKDERDLEDDDTKV